MELLRRNEKINKVFLIDQNNKAHGEVSVAQAFNIADSAGLDVVQVDYNKDDVMVCKVLDWGKIKYSQSKRKTQHQKKTKEVTIKGNIGENDLKRKVGDVHKFYNVGMDVVVTIIAHRYAANKLEIMERITALLPVGSDTSIQSVSASKRIIKIRGRKD